MKRIRCKPRQGVLIAMFCLLGSMTVFAQSAVPGMIKDKSGSVYKGMIRFKALSQVYVVEYKAGAGSKMVSEVKASDVVAMRIQPPAALSSAIKAVQSRQYASAVGPLEKVYKDYKMMEHDVTAARWLMECYLNLNKASQAVSMGKKVLDSNPNAITAEFFAMYADALIATKQNSELRNMIKKAIESGNREAAAVAQIKRGDMDMQAGRYKDALRDGYLRTVLLFREIKSARPEALYKAFKCFTEIGQQRYAEDMRKKLLSEFPQSSYARQIGSG